MTHFLVDEEKDQWKDTEKSATCTGTWLLALANIKRVGCFIQHNVPLFNIRSIFNPLLPYSVNKLLYSNPTSSMKSLDVIIMHDLIIK